MDLCVAGQGQDQDRDFLFPMAAPLQFALLTVCIHTGSHVKRTIFEIMPTKGTTLSKEQALSSPTTHT
jgi:hypothetical protein